MPKLAVLVLVVVALLYFCATALLYTQQRSFLYFPDRQSIAPAAMGLSSAERLAIKTRDGETLAAWFLRGPGDRIIVYFHGNGGSLADRSDRFRNLVASGFSVLAIDYRGYGASTGTPTEAGLHADADATYDMALKLGFAPGHMLLFGESLGSGVALELASRRPVAGIILDSPYSSVVDVAADRFWFMPVRFLLKDTYRSDLWIGHVTVPILMVHGTVDRVVPFRYGRRLAALGGQKVTFIEVPGGEHVVWDDVDDDPRVIAWLQAFKSP